VPGIGVPPGKRMPLRRRREEPSDFSVVYFTRASEKMTAKKASSIRASNETDRRRGIETPAQEQARKMAEMTVGKFFDASVMIYQRANNKSYPKTEQRFNAHVRPFFGDKQFHQVSIMEVCQWRDEMLTREEGRLAEGTVSIVMNILRQCFRMARDMGVTTENIFDEITLRGGRTVRKISIPKPKLNNRERALTHKEAEVLMEAARNWAKKPQGDPDAPYIILLALKQGLRASECANLQVKDVILETSQIMLWDQKNGKKMPIRMAPSVRDMFMKRLSSKELCSQEEPCSKEGEETNPVGSYAPEDLVFPRPRSKKKRDNLAHMMRKIVSTTDLNRGREHDPYQVVVFHTLRHTFGTWLAQSGVDIKTIQKLLRHADIKDTLRYMNQAPSYEDHVIDRLDSSWAVPSSGAPDESLPPNVIPIRSTK